MLSKDLKYLGAGLGIGGLISGFFIVSIYFLPLVDSAIGRTRTAMVPPPADSQTALPSADHTPLATITPSPSRTFTPTPTYLLAATVVPTTAIALTSTELLIALGEISIAGPLNRQQHKRLYEASLTFIAPTVEQSRQLSALINLQPYSDPSTICGPLSIAILQRAGILSQELIPFDFFLINPYLGKDRRILKSAFPADLYENTRIRIKLNEFDWAAEPMMPGDFVYVYSGSGGNFEHMLVVNRVDLAGRAYSVTNVNTGQGFVIDQVMLYDPHDPNAGIFAQWTQRENQLLGSTGFAGFEVWRLRNQ